MFLFKCKCGCFFSVKKVPERSVFCQNCGQAVPASPYTSLRDLAAVAEKSGYSIQLIPDDANINVSFNF